MEWDEINADKKNVYLKLKINMYFFIKGVYILAKLYFCFQNNQAFK